MSSLRLDGNIKVLIYKYVPTPRFFSNFKFRFTPAEDLNDPKELVPDIRLRNPSAYARSITQRNIVHAYFELLLSKPDLTPAEAWARCAAAADQIERQFDLVTTVRDLYEKFMRTTNKNVGVLSLAEDPCIMPMWAHYADEYKGLVIGLDADSEFFQPKPEEPKVCGQLMNVLYTDTSPVVYVEAGNLDIPKELFFTKARNWDYEKEWRIIKYLPQASEVADGPGGKKIHLFEVPPCTVREVIFGSKTSADVQEQVERALLAHAPHVVKKRATFVQGDAGLRIAHC